MEYVSFTHTGTSCQAHCTHNPAPAHLRSTIPLVEGLPSLAPRLTRESRLKRGEADNTLRNNSAKPRLCVCVCVPPLTFPASRALGERPPSWEPSQVAMTTTAGAHLQSPSLPPPQPFWQVLGETPIRDVVSPPETPPSLRWESPHPHLRLPLCPLPAISGSPWTRQRVKGQGRACERIPLTQASSGALVLMS